MSKYFNICNIYILLWCLYSLQGTLYAGGSAISQVILMLALLISVFYTIYTLIKVEMSPYLKAISCLLVMLTIYGAVLMMSNEQLYMRDSLSFVSKKDYLKNIYSSLLPIYTFFVFAKKGLLTELLIRKWIPIFILVAIASFIRQQNEALARAAEEMSLREEFTNNAGYLFLAIVPMLLFVKKPILQYLFLLICGVFIIAAIKRGAILIYAISLIPFFYWTLKGVSFSKKFLVFILIVIGALSVVYYASHMFDTSEYFQARIEQTLAGNASNREDMYPHLLRQIFYFATPLQFLFGRGAWGTLKVSENFAHNDWLEIGINQGMLGIFLYIIYWIAFYITARGISNSTARNALMLIIFIFLIKTMFSMSYDSMPIYATIVIGYCMANYKNNNAQYAENNMLY